MTVLLVVLTVAFFFLLDFLIHRKSSKAKLPADVILHDYGCPTMADGGEPVVKVKK